MARTGKGSPRIRALGAELREHRETAGWTVRAVAQKLGGHHSKYARFETGDQAPTSEQVAAMLATYGVAEKERVRLAEMAQSDEDNWLKAGVSDARDELTTLMEFERTATAITDVSPIVLPGLFQTSDYARAIMTGIPPGDVERLVAMRLGRRDVLMRKNAPALTAIIMERALREPIGGHEAMVDQLRHVMKMAEMENVTVQVLRGGSTLWTPAHAGPYILFEFPKAAPIVHLEHLSSSAFLSNTGDVRVYRDAAVNLREAAMNPADSAKFIAECAQEMEDNQ